jgi:TonB-dependent SusC/RagA subfamily outer membrane receptor
MKIRIIICLIIASFSFSSGFSQKAGKNIKISGYVVDGTRASIANAVVMIDGKSTNNFTDEKGYYEVKVKSGSSLIGILTTTNGFLEEPINGRTRINFEFGGSVPDQAKIMADPGDEAVNVGYGTVRKKDMTTNVSKIDASNPKYASYRNIYDMIKGEVPGVQVTGTSIKIQGVSSLTSGTEPLFVLDGVVVNSINDIQPAMVKSIEILKGASASIYGSRGANGVILINLISASDR